MSKTQDLSALVETGQAFVIPQRRELLCLIADHFARFHGRLKGIPNIEYLGLAELKSTQITGRLFEDVATILRNNGIPVGSTMGDIIEGLSLTQEELHSFGCSCHGDLWAATIALRFRWLGRSPQVEAWVNGETDERPPFSDPVFDQYISSKRHQTWVGLQTTDPARARSMLEFRNHDWELIYSLKLLSKMRREFGPLVPALPTFAAYVEAHPYVDVKDNRRTRRMTGAQSRKQYRMAIVSGFLAQCDQLTFGAIHDVIGWKLPWWANVPNSDEVELKQAA